MVNQKKKRLYNNVLNGFISSNGISYCQLNLVDFMCKNVISQQRSLPQGVFFCVCVFAVDRRCRRRPSNNSSQPPPTCPQRVSQSAPLQRFSRIFTYRVARRCFFKPPFLSLSPPLSFSSLLNLALSSRFNTPADDYTQLLRIIFYST